MIFQNPYFNAEANGKKEVKLRQLVVVKNPHVISFYLQTGSKYNIYKK